MSELYEELLSVLKQEAKAFIENHQEDVLELGQDTVEAILFSELVELDPIANLPEGAPTQLVVLHEDLLAKRSEQFQLVSKAQREHSERVARIKEGAKGVVGRFFSIFAGYGLKILLGAA